MEKYSFKYKNSLSAGRCQTPALRLVYDNYREILESPDKLSFNTNGYFTSKNIQFALNTNHDSHESIEEFLESSKTFDHRLSRDKEKETKKIRLYHLLHLHYSNQQIIICIFRLKKLWH